MLFNKKALKRGRFVQGVVPGKNFIIKGLPGRENFWVQITGEENL